MLPHRWLRAPLVHFLAGGAALFWTVHASSPAGRAPVEPVVVTAADVARLRSDYVRETGLEPSDADEAALVEKAVEEELLFREAVTRGLDRNDRSVRNWLVEQMKVVGDGGDDAPERLYARAQALGLDRTDLVVRRILVQNVRLLIARADEQIPSEAELAAFYDAHRDDYVMPGRSSFWHVFVSSDVHGPAVLRDAEALLDTLRRAGRPPIASGTAGDPFVVPARVVAQSPSQIAKVFGATFAGELARVETRAWTGPIASPHGVHLVWVDDRETGAAPPLEAVRGRVLARWQEERRARGLVALLHDLKRRYPLQIESRAWQARSRS